MQIGYTTDPARADGASIDNPVSIENESLMITKDFNLTNVDFYVEYMVTDPVQAVLPQKCVRVYHQEPGFRAISVTPSAFIMLMM